MANAKKTKNMPIFEFSDYLALGSKCVLIKTLGAPICHAVYQSAEQKMCVTGCAHYNKGQCPGYVELMEKSKQAVSG
jgi:hypothetical protein